MMVDYNKLPFGPTSKPERSSNNPVEAFRFKEVDPEALEESEKIVIPLEELRENIDDIVDAIYDASLEKVSEPEEFREIQYRLTRAKERSQRMLEEMKTETRDAPELSKIVEPKLEGAISKLEGKVEEAERFLRGKDFEEALAIADVDISDMIGEMDTLINPLKTNIYLKRESPERKGKGVVSVPF